MDIKCPGSGEADSNLWSNIAQLSADDEIKFVIRDRADYEWALQVISDKKLSDLNLLFSPVWGELELQQLAWWMLEDNAPGRLQTQLHKHIWNAQTPGV